MTVTSTFDKGPTPVNIVTHVNGAGGGGLNNHLQTSLGLSLA